MLYFLILLIYIFFFFSVFVFFFFFFFFSSRRRHTRLTCDWSSDVCSSDLCWVGAVYEAVFRWLEQPSKGRLPADRLAKTIAAFNLRGIGAPAETIGDTEIGRASCRKECRSRWSPNHEKKKKEK